MTVLRRRVTVGWRDTVQGWDQICRKRNLPKHQLFFLNRRQMSALVSELPSCPSHETRDRQTQQGQNSKHRALPGHRAPHSPRALCCCSPAIPGAQDGKELHSGQCIHPEENAALPLLCAGLGSIPFAPEEQTKIIQALQALHSSPCRQMFSCCVLCVCTGEPEAFELSVVL